uniref:Uncharacterized protein n=1 Tax=Grammatophora oceanica TaxID=210454 RepID=A0A7S1Y5N2_9STRA|mmetsp:Transcript_30955/g.45893  ORF Transcript_30955/g.45893 Transcript_30955/m.45893 type:complete len:864 (+) Transcript_30955:109-2700(+)|eukprot:CAMPEP_0194049544 /NCGR_PEP_ID=MMETSP0009_2-20130614/30742_1 /TAXON_ID=210454 /ORGANISM="Grammatophora oceanica, Strain CCMP 410" /LENGTH=863 /DNA_ID=CAMNT_0038695729 /DNA_START=89 /DNA_END=2680 /DNA_ORIENTATION=-
MSSFSYFRCNGCYDTTVSQEEKIIVLDPSAVKKPVFGASYGDIDDIIARFRSKSGSETPTHNISTASTTPTSNEEKTQGGSGDIRDATGTWTVQDDATAEPEEASYETIPEHMYTRRLKANDPNLTIFRVKRSEVYGDIAEFASALENNTVLQHLALDSWFLDDYQIDFVANALVSHPTLEVIDLSDNHIGSKGLASILRLFRHFNVIKKLHLSNNQIGDVGAALLAEELQNNTTLQEISLSGNGIGDEGVAAILNTLEHSKTSVVFLEIDYSQVSDREYVEDRLNRLLMLNRKHVVLPDVAKNIRLLETGYEGPNSPKKMSTGCRGMGESSAKAMATSLRKCTWLCTLDLTNQNTIGDEGAIAFANALKENSTLQELFLGGNLITDRGAQAFVDLLVDANCTLQIIDLTDNNVSQDVLEKMNVLLARNRNGSPMGQVAGLFMRLNSNDPALKHLYVNDKEIGNKASKRLAEALSKNTYVTTIDISSNNIGDIGAISFGEMLRENTTLQSLNLKNNYITSSGGQSILTALHHNSTVTELELGDGVLGEMEQLQLEILLARNRAGQEMDSLAHYTQRLSENDPTLTAINLDQAGDDGLKMLSGALLQNTVLTELFLTSNDITDKGVKHLAVALEMNKTVREVSLYGNSITDCGAMMLLYVMQTNKTVTFLDLRKNEEVSEDLLEKLDLLTKQNRMNHTVQKLAVSNAVARLQANDPSLTDVSLNYEYLGDEGAMIYAGALKENTYLANLNLSHASIGDSGAQILASAVHNHPTLTCLSLAWNDFTRIGVTAVALALRKNKVINELDLSGCRGEDAGATALLELLLYNKNICKLSYDETGVPDCTIANIDQLLKRNSKFNTSFLT